MWLDSLFRSTHSFFHLAVRQLDTSYQDPYILVNRPTLQDCLFGLASSCYALLTGGSAFDRDGRGSAKNCTSSERDRRWSLDAKVAKTHLVAHNDH